MKEEVLDLYDNQFNRLSNKIKRNEAIPIECNIMMSYVLIKNNNKYLLEKLTKKDKSKWGIPGGHILSGETASEGLIRELKEELGIKNINIQLIEKIKYPYNNYIFNIYFTEQQLDISKLILQSDEVIKLEWFTKEEIIQMIEDNPPLMFLHIY